MITNPLRAVLPVTVGSIRMLKDGTVTIQVHSVKELDDLEFAQLHMIYRKLGWFVFSETNIADEEIPKEDIDVDIKSQAQRIRGKVYHLCKKREEAGEDVDFDVLYRQATNWLIANLDKRIAEYD